MGKKKGKRVVAMSPRDIKAASKDRYRPPVKATKTPAVGALTMKFGASAMSRAVRQLAWARQAGSVHIAGHTWPTPKGWVPLWLLSHPSVGGPSIERRFIEMRSRSAVAGIPSKIERRSYLDDNGDRHTEYRIVKPAKPARKGEL